MSNAALRPMAARRLRVGIRAADPARHARLRRVLLDAGHDVVDAFDTLDVVVADCDYASTGATPVVVVGGTSSDPEGSLPRDADESQIDAAVRAVAAGLVVRVRAAAAAGFGTMKESRLAVLLTPREIEVLNAIVEGLPNKSIAQRLDISPHTVKFHIEAVFRKLGVRTRTEAAAKAWMWRSETLEM